MTGRAGVTATATRVAAAVVTGVALLGGVSLAGAARERADLPTAAKQLLQASVQASAVTDCLQGARDEVYVPGAPQLHDATAVAAAERRLSGCDVESLARALDAVHVPPAAPVTTAARRRARADVVTGVALLRRVVLDARAADRLMRQSLVGVPDGTAVVLAYRSAAAGSDTAYQDVEEALALLGDPQSTVING